MSGQSSSCRIAAGDGILAGDLTVPGPSRGIVVFAHGSGSSRHSPRNRFVARVLHDAGFATLLLDLLSEDEERADATTGHFRFDIGFLANRLGAAIDWALDEPTTRELRMGLFGASTGAAAALVAAAERPDAIEAVVSRGGRPDLAGEALARVRAPTMLIVGGDDVQVLALHRQAMASLRVETRLEIIPGTGHLFEEPGALEQVSILAREWLERHLSSSRKDRFGRAIFS